MSDFIKTFYTKEAYLNAEKPVPFIGYIIETGETKYLDVKRFTNDFSNDFELIDAEYYRRYFDFYK